MDHYYFDLSKDRHKQLQYRNNLGHFVYNINNEIWALSNNNGNSN